MANEATKKTVAKVDAKEALKSIGAKFKEE